MGIVEGGMETDMEVQGAGMGIAAITLRQQHAVVVEFWPLCCVAFFVGGLCNVSLRISSSFTGFLPPFSILLLFYDTFGFVVFLSLCLISGRVFHSFSQKLSINEFTTVVIIIIKI